jgi:hypothetical protein
MPKATVATPSGAKVTIEGTNDEVIALVARLEGLGEGERRHARSSTSARSNSQSKSKPTLSGLIFEMISGGFFKEPKHLGALKDALEQNGQFYPVTTLSPTMLRLVRARQLRRIKDSKGRWSYVG